MPNQIKDCFSLTTGLYSIIQSDRLTIQANESLGCDHELSRANTEVTQPMVGSVWKQYLMLQPHLKQNGRCPESAQNNVITMAKCLKPLD